MRLNAPSISSPKPGLYTAVPLTPCRCILYSRRQLRESSLLQIADTASPDSCKVRQGLYAGPDILQLLVGTAPKYTLVIHIARSRCYLHTSGPKVGVIYMLLSQWYSARFRIDKLKVCLMIAGPGIHTEPFQTGFRATDGVRQAPGSLSERNFSIRREVVFRNFFSLYNENCLLILRQHF